MPAAFVQTHTSGTSTTSDTTVAATIATAAVPIGNLLALWVGFDNTATSTPTVSSVSVPAGETATWAKVASHDSSNASAAAGCRGEMWVIVTTQSWAVAQAVTVTLSAAVTAKAVVLKEFSGAAVTVRGTAGTGTSTNTVPTASTSGTALEVGDLVLGGAAFEAGAAPTADADTLNGSWANTATALAGAANPTGISVITQHKIVTATGAQTYNPTHGAGIDSGAAIVALTPSATSASFAGWGIPL